MKWGAANRSECDFYALGDYLMPRAEDEEGEFRALA
jgi:hypothetical protein